MNHKDYGSHENNEWFSNGLDQRATHVNDSDNPTIFYESPLFHPST